MMCMSEELIFAIKWKEEFNKEKALDTEGIIKYEMGKECEKIGFIMDEGKSFYDKYGVNILDFKKLDQIINEITNIRLLGSVIFSIWRVLSEKMNESFLSYENKRIFLKLLDRLEELSNAEMLNIFMGEARKITINSTDSFFPRRIMSNSEKEQKITINSEGGVWFSSYSYSMKYGLRKKRRKRKFKINKEIANNIIKTMSDYFRNPYKWDRMICDAGGWDLEITNTNGNKYKYSGDTVDESYSFPGKDFSFSDMIRKAIGIKYLYLFDGEPENPQIEKIDIAYNRVTKFDEITGSYKDNGNSDKVIYLKFKNEEKSEEENLSENENKDIVENKITKRYSEHLIIDGVSGSAEYIKNREGNDSIHVKYEAKHRILNLLNKIKEELDLSEPFGNSDDIVDIPYESTDYKMTITYDDYTPYFIEGSFDNNGLPSQFDKLAELISDIIKECGYAEILDPLFYRRKRRHKSELIFCRVVFGNGPKSYYYITDDDDIRIGDKVLVPAGYDNHESVARVKDIEYYKIDEVPMPIEKTKRIICKYKK